MAANDNYDVIIVGGSYSGLSAGMALGRALKKVLIIDDGKPCNRQTPYSHNFITHDGKTPLEIATIARNQLQLYNTLEFFNAVATTVGEIKNGFEIQVSSGETFSAKKIIFATGIRDMLPDIDGMATCWGISVLHCPYCHGYEVRHEKTGVLANGVIGFDFTRLISNWTNDLTLFTNGSSTLTAEQRSKLQEHHIDIIEKEIDKLEQVAGYIRHIIFKDGTKFSIKALYASVPFEQHCTIPETLGCRLTEEGYIQVDTLLETTISGIYACGDNVTTMRTVTNAVAMGTAAGISVSKKLTFENF